eukprot:XP_002262454.1 Isoprenylcysteine carboxyl methyltransferase,putative [Plasmodium knowlesi strain H]
MNVGVYLLTAFLLYASLLNYKTLVHLITPPFGEHIQKGDDPVYNAIDKYLHIFLEYGFVSIYLIVAFKPHRNVYSKQSPQNYLFAKVLLVFFFFFLFHFLLNIKNNFPLNIFYLILTTFHLSEFFLSFLHNKNNSNYYNFLVNPNCGYVYFFILTLLEYYAKIFFFVLVPFCEKYFSKRLLQNLLIVNYFFFKNFVQNGRAVCTYFYVDQIDWGVNRGECQVGIGVNSNLGTDFTVGVGAGESSLLRLLQNRIRMRGELHRGAFALPLAKRQGCSSQGDVKYTGEKNACFTGDVFSLGGIYGECLFTTGPPPFDTCKKYDLNNSIYQKIIHQYAGIFDKYEVKGSYKRAHKYHLFFVLLCMLFSLCGLLLRILGLAHCSKNFSFYVMDTDHLVDKCIKNKHTLVKSGVYKYMRHPCYTGWFFYALFLQLLLLNPFCFVLSFFVLWAYFYHTIRMEEKYLLECYGEEYRNYKLETPNI